MSKIRKNNTNKTWRKDEWTKKIEDGYGWMEIMKI